MKKNIAVVVGGNSSEYFISLKSGEYIANNIDKDKFNVYVVTIKGSDWELTSDLYCGLIINKNDFSFNDNGQKVKFDCAYIVIHGTPGEDGKLQSYFEMINLPYVGTNVLTSALTFNKYFCNTFLRQSDILMANSVLVKKGDKIDTKKLIANIGLPCFVKPNEGGSSFGISKVKKEDELIPAIEKAYEESKQVIIEQFIDGKEITVGLVKTKNKDYIFTPIEIISDNEFFDYEAKYNDAKNQEIIPARISNELTKKSKNLASEIYDILDCSGIVRVDYILSNNKFYFLEINTIPGMTKESLLPKEIREYGLDFKKLLSEIIDNSINN